MKLKPTAIAVAAVLSVAGTVFSADFFDGNGQPLARPSFHVADSPDGDMPVATLHGPAARIHEAIAALNASGGNQVATRGLEALFVPTGEGVEADSHADVEFLPDGSAYILVNRASQNLVLFNASDRSLLAEIPISGSPQAIALTSDGTRAVTANLDGTASIVDLVGMTETSVLTLGTLPGAVRISPDDALAVVNNTVDQTLSVIDLSTDAVIGTVSAGAGSFTFSANFETGSIGLAFTEFEFVDNDTVVYPSVFNDELLFIDVLTGSTNAVPTLQDPAAISISEDGSVGVVSHRYSETQISVIDIANQSVSTTISTGSAPNGPIVISADGTKAVVGISNAAVVVDLVNQTTGPSLSTASINQLVRSSDGQRALAVGYRGSVISFATNSLITNTNNQISTSIGAVNPTSDQAVMFSDTFGEDVVEVSIGASGAGLVAYESSGPGIEGDKARTVAITPDGTRAVVAHSHSDNVAIVDTATGTVLGHAPIGQRAGRVAITPDGSKAVVANRDSYFATVIDLDTLTSTNVDIGRRGDQVEISPDGQYAYIAVVADGDGVWRIDLTTNTPAGKVFTGDMSSTNYGYQQFAGMDLSPDGSTLVTCDSYGNTLTIIDTASWSVAQTIATSGTPAVVAFSNDGNRFFVSNRDGDSVSIYAKTLGIWALQTTIPVGDAPYALAPSADDAYLFVTNFNDKSLSTIDLTTNSVVQTESLPNSPAGIVVAPDGEGIYVPTSFANTTVGGAIGFSQSQGGELNIIHPEFFVIADQIPFDVGVSDVAASADGTVIAMSAPAGDGVVVIGQPEINCPVDVTGDGSVDLADLNLVLANFGQTTADGDTNNDGVVDLADLNAVLASFGTTCD